MLHGIQVLWQGVFDQCVRYDSLYLNKYQFDCFPFNLRVSCVVKY